MANDSIDKEFRCPPTHDPIRWLITCHVCLLMNKESRKIRRVSTNDAHNHTFNPY